MIRALVIGWFVLSFFSGCAPDITETDFYSRHPDEIASGPSEVMLLDHQNNGVEIKLTTEKALQWGPNTIEIESTGNPTNVELAVFLDTGAALLTSDRKSVV